MEPDHAHSEIEAGIEEVRAALREYLALCTDRLNSATTPEERQHWTAECEGAQSLLNGIFAE